MYFIKEKVSRENFKILLKKIFLRKTLARTTLAKKTNKEKIYKENFPPQSIHQLLENQNRNIFSLHLVLFVLGFLSDFSFCIFRNEMVLQSCQSRFGLTLENQNRTSPSFLSSSLFLFGLWSFIYFFLNELNFCSFFLQC